MSNGNVMVVVFQSDKNVGGSGFEATLVFWICFVLVNLSWKYRELIENFQYEKQLEEKKKTGKLEKNWS